VRTRFEAAPAPRSLDAGLKPHRRRVTVTKVSPYGDDGKRLREADMLVPERVRLGFFFRYVYEPERQEIVWPERPPTAEPPPAAAAAPAAAPAGPSAPSQPRPAPASGSKALGPRVAQLEAQNKLLVDDNARLWLAIDALRQAA